MIPLFLEGMHSVFSWPTILYALTGIFLGFLFGIIPGLAGANILALLLPFTFAMKPEMGIALMAGAMGSVTFAGSIPAILINTPGTPSNAATCLDGYPLAQKGEAGYALGAAAAASALGAIIGLAFLMASIPLMRQIILAFGPPEIFLITLVGLSLILAISSHSMINSLISGALGLLLSFHGISSFAVDHRFVYGSYYLWDGIGLIPLLIGIFAIAEMIHLAVVGKTISRSRVLKMDGVLRGMKAAVKHWKILIQSSIIGVVIGIIPGIGGTISSFLAYFQAKRTSDDRDTFGKGNIKGIIAAEAANDAKDGGALMITLALGIPGSPTTAVFLGALVLHGVYPGQNLFNENLNLIVTLIITLIFSNVVASSMALIFSDMFSRITLIHAQIIAPVIVVVSLAGTYAYARNLNDISTAILFGAIGYLMLRFNYNRLALVIAFLLGQLLERTFHLSLQISDGSYAIFFTRPASIAIIAISVISFLVAIKSLGLSGWWTRFSQGR